MKVVIACGGSGGHIYPGLSLASTLREREKDTEIIFVAGQKGLERKLLGGEKSVLFLPIVGMPSIFSWRFPLFLVKFSISLAVCFFRMRRIRPDVFVGFGGYVSGPVILTGLFLGRPIFIHEENVIPGRANLWLSRWARRDAVPFRVGVAFEESRKWFRQDIPVVCVGNPLRRDLAAVPAQEGRHHFGLEENRFTFLISGGSQGSHRLNRILTQALAKTPQEERSSFQVVHLAGERDADRVERCYEALGIAARVFAFTERMGEAYSAADVVIARGGAMTLSEIGHFRKPALLIPLPLARNHQLENVKYLASRGACVVFDEERAMTEAFPRELLNLKRDPSRRKGLSEKLASFYPNGSRRRLAQEVGCLVTEKSNARNLI